jgi:hypothetical protein
LGYTLVEPGRCRIHSIKAPFLLSPQTCRKLHDVCSLNSVWYHFYKHLPLESKWHDLDLISVTSGSWQGIVMQAIKTDHNWKRPSPHLRRLQKICDGRFGTGNHVRLFNRGKALFWISYHPRDLSPASKSTISIWDISSLETPQMRWKFNSLGLKNFFDLYEGSGRVVLAYGGDVRKVQG